MGHQTPLLHRVLLVMQHQPRRCSWRAKACWGGKLQRQWCMARAPQSLMSGVYAHAKMCTALHICVPILKDTFKCHLFHSFATLIQSQQYQLTYCIYSAVIRIWGAHYIFRLVRSFQKRIKKSFCTLPYLFVAYICTQSLRSFGVLLWEMATYGSVPHADLSTNDVLQNAMQETLKLTLWVHAIAVNVNVFGVELFGVWDTSLVHMHV